MTKISSRADKYELLMRNLAQLTHLKQAPDTNNLIVDDTKQTKEDRLRSFPVARACLRRYACRRVTHAASSLTASS